MSAEWLQWFVIVFAAFGLAAILRDGDIADPFRRLLSLTGWGARFVRCWLCLGWWSGLAPAWLLGCKGRLLLLVPFVTAGTTYLLGAFLATLQLEEIPPPTEPPEGPRHE